MANPTDPGLPGFRAELDGGSSVQAALERTVDTAGRAVAFSGLAVAAGLSGLLFYRGSFLAAMGLGSWLSAGSGAGWIWAACRSRPSVSGPGCGSVSPAG